jgi:hypothetical protein
MKNSELINKKAKHLQVFRLQISLLSFRFASAIQIIFGVNFDKTFTKSIWVAMTLLMSL